MRSSFGRTTVGKAIPASSIRTRLGKSSELGMVIRSPRKGLFLSLYVDDIKLGGKKQNINPTWKILMNMLIWENQHHSLTTFTLVALKEKEKPAKILLTVLNDLCRSYRKIPSSGDLMRTHLHGPMTWEVMQRSTWKDIANWRTKPPSNRIKFQLHDLMTVNSKKKNGYLWENCQNFALKSS